MTTQFCYGHIRGQRPGQRIGLIKYLDSGYYPCDKDYDLPDAEQVDIHIDALNAVRGIALEVREGMEAGSMFGWRCPAAIPALKHFGAPEIDPEEEKKLHPVPPQEEMVHAGPCLHCGHPPRCHEAGGCDDSRPSEKEPCDNYEPDPTSIVKVKARKTHA